MPEGMTRDELRTAGLLFGEELALGLVEPAALRVPEVLRAVRSTRVPATLTRRIQQHQMRRGRLTWEGHSAGPRMAARRAVLGEAALGRPKVLVRVDAFPHPDAWDDPERVGTGQARAVHETLHGAGVPYLMSVAPRVARRPLDATTDESREHDEGERDLLRRLRREGVAFGLHGLDRRSRSARRPSEFAGLGRKGVDARLDAAQEAMREEALHADVFVPPYDRFDARDWGAFAARFDVVCGGPAAVGTMGFHATPAWRGDTVWMPAYAPLAGPAAQVLEGVRALAEQGTSLWIPVALDWGQEQADDGAALRELCAYLAAGELARSWEDFLLAVVASRQLASTMGQSRR